MAGPFDMQRLLTPRNARFTLLLLSLLTVFFAWSLRNVRLDHEFERFFPTDDPELDHYNAFRERFGNDNDMLLIAASNTPSVFREEFLHRIDTLAGSLAVTEHVLSVTTPTRMKELRVTPLGAFEIPWLRVDGNTLPNDSARIFDEGGLKGSFVSEDAQAILILVQTAPDLSKEKSDRLLEAVTGLVEASGLQEARLAGRLHGQYWYIEKMKRELAIFFSLSVLLLTLFLAIVNRTLWGVLVPVGVVGLTVLWQVAIVTLMGHALTILTMLLPTILFVVGMSDVVHILERYIEALRNGHARPAALAVAYREVGLATFLTSLTTAIGFATLLTSSIGPIREFGIYTGLGVFLAFFLAFTLLPATLLLVPTPVQATRRERESFWHPWLSGLFAMVLRHRRRIPAMFALLTLISGYFILQLKVDNRLLEDWAEDDPQKQAYYWFDEHFGGARPFEVEVAALRPGVSVWDLEVLQDMEKVEQHIQAEYGIAAIISPAVVIRAMNRAINGGLQEFHRLPDGQREHERLVRRLNMLPADALRTVATPDGTHGRISGRKRDEGGYQHRSQDVQLQAFIRENTDTGLAGFKQTGMAWLIDRNNEKLSAQMIGGLSIAFLLISLIMARVFRSWRMTVIALIPNLIPLIFVGGFMGAVGIDIKVSTAIIFTIAFGIAVDDTIHMLGKLRVELLKGRTLPYAMKRSFFSAGKALIITSILLLSGFISLVFSDFASIFYMGLLVSMTLFIALLADLVLLPVLVLKWLPKRL